MNPNRGTLYGIGIGPGDPDLITLKALRLLRSVPVLTYPAPEHGPSLARHIVTDHIPIGRIEIPIRMPMVAARFPAREVYDRAVNIIGEHLDAGRDVAYLCEGDPFFYGSFSFLFQRMIDHYSIEVVPGVSSLMGCAAVLGAPLATRDDVLCVLPATLGDQTLRTHLQRVDTAVIIKVGRHLARIRDLLDSLGLLAQARYVEHATMNNEQAMWLSTVEFDTAPYFSTVLVHKRGKVWR